MSVSLQETPAIWWETHQDQIQYWSTIKAVSLYRFLPPNEILHKIPTYDGRTCPQEHVEHCCFIWEVDGLEVEMWLHLFIHSLGNILQACYLQEELK